MTYLSKTLYLHHYASFHPCLKWEWSITVDAYFKLRCSMKAWWKSPLCIAEERHRYVDIRNQALFMETGAQRSDWLFFGGLYNFMKMRLRNTGKTVYSGLGESGNCMCPNVGEWRGEQASSLVALDLADSLKSLQITLRKPSGGNYSWGPLNVMFWNGN